MLYMVSLTQPCASTGVTRVLAHKYCVTNVFYIVYFYFISISECPGNAPCRILTDGQNGVRACRPRHDGHTNVLIVRMNS